MAKTIEEWLNSDVAELEELSLEELGNTFFFRDPMRSNFIDNEHFYSPADGVILYQKIVEADEPVVEIKGKNYKLKDVLGDNTYNQKSLVVGIFMTFYSVHINRVPYSGILKYEKLEPIESTNQPMLAIEKDILKKTINPKNMFKYIKQNERMINTIYSPRLDYTYYVTQIADEDVDVIAHFHQDQNRLFGQNERFSLIRWGSQCELVLPLDSRYSFTFCQEEKMVVEAGLDKLVKIEYL